MIVRELFARLGMKTDPGSFQRADKSLDRIKRVAATIAGILVDGRIVRGFSRIITETVAAADSVVKTSEKLGVGAQALQEYQFAAQLAGVNVRTFNMGLQRFSRRTAEAAKGTGEAKDALKEMGIQLKDNQGRLRPADDLLLDVADSISKVSDEGEKVRLAFKLFDSEGVSLINMLKGGSGALKAMRAEARATGGVFSEEFLQASEDMTDQLLRLKMSGQGLKVMLTTALLPAINASVEWLLRTSRAIRETLKGTKVLQVAFGLLAAAATVLVFVLGFKLLGAVGALALSLVGLASGLTTAGVAAFLLQIKMVAIGAVFIALTALIFLLAEEIVGAFTGMDTAGGLVTDMLDDLYDRFLKLGEGKAIIEALLFPLKTLAMALRTINNIQHAGLMALFSGDLSGYRKLSEDLEADLERSRISLSTIGILPRPQAAAAGAGGAAVTLGNVTIEQTIQGTSDPATTAKMAGEGFRQVLREEVKTAKQALIPAKATP